MTGTPTAPAPRPPGTRPSTRPMHEGLYRWSASFDAPALIAAFHDTLQQPEPGVIRNFLGTRIEALVYPPILAGREGMVEPVPDPGNWHADIAEWAAALHSVDKARGSYRVVELGCGWGCWITNMGVAARTRGLQVQLVGVEGDRRHLENAARTLALNGFGPGDWALHHAVAGPRHGKAIFPDPEGQSHWGAEPVFYPDAAQLAEAERSPGLQVLDCMTLADLADGGMIDLLHIDIQGGEADFVEGNAEGLAAHVRRVLIGTHSRVIEGRLIAHFLAAGWRMEMERPAIMELVGGRPDIRIDGVQLWANPALATE